MERFDVFNAKENGADEPVPSVEAAEPKPATNGHKKSHSPSSKREAEDSEMSDVIDDAPPKKKKRKASSPEDDAAFAARLQAEEDRNARPTRGGSSRKSAPAKKKSGKKKTNNKVTASDDSDVEDGTTKRKVNRNTGFHKPMNLSESASEFFGTAQVCIMNLALLLANCCSFRDQKSPSKSGNISKAIICKILVTNDTSSAMRSFYLYLAVPRYTCSR